MLQSLYARLFVAFWIAMLLVLAGSFVVFELSGPPPHWVQRRTLFEDGLRLQADLAYETLDTEGPTAAAAQLEGLAQRTGIRMALLQDGEVVAGEVTDDELARVRRAPEAHAGVRELDAGDEHHELLPLEGGRAAFTRRGHPSSLARLVGPHVPERLVIMALVAGLLSWFLARTLAGPLGRLRGAAQRLAAGDLEARVGPEVAGSTAEVRALGADFDRMAEQLAGLLESQRRLLRDVSHELRSPLARLQVALGLARRDRAAEAPLDRIELEAERLGELIGQILTLTRLDSEPPAREPFDAADVLDQVVRDARYEAGEGAVTLAAPDTLPAAGNAEVFRWAVENVLRNALRFTAEGTAVEVRAETHDGRLELTLRDHGPGVPEEELEPIFRPFYRVGTDRDRRTGGRGVGLAIAERTVATHGGTIRAENAPGGGLRVHITLPLA